MMAECSRRRPAAAASVLAVLILLGGLAAAARLEAQSGGAPGTVDQLKERILDLQNAGRLGFRKLVLCSEIRSYGQYAAYPTPVVREGSTVYLYYEPENVFTQREGGLYRVRFTQDLIIRTADGQELLNAPQLLEFVYESASPVLDIYAQNTVRLAGLEPGRYLATLVLRDQLGFKEARADLAFAVE